MNPWHVNIRTKPQFSLSQGITVAEYESWCQEEGSERLQDMFCIVGLTGLR
jgi:hypothetical protein